MKRIKIGNKKYNFPQSWRDITLKQFNELKTNEESFTRMDENSLANCVLSVLTEIPVDVILTLTTEQKESLLKELLVVITLKMKDVTNDFVKIEDKYFYMEKDDSKISIGQYIDYTIAVKGQTDLIKTSHITASILFKEIVPRNKIRFFFKRLLNTKLVIDDFIAFDYDADKALSNAEMFYEKLPVEYGNSANNFFLRSSKRLSPLIQDYSNQDQTKKTQSKEYSQEIEKLLTKEMRNSLLLDKSLTPDGVGI
jgi:hypothetical protein